MNIKDEILNDPSQVKKALLLLLSANSQEPIKGKLWYQKLLYLLSKNKEELADECSFDAYHFGPHSELADSEMEELEQLGLVSKDGGKYFLTDEGKALAKEVAKMTPKNELEMVEELKKFMNGLASDELLLYVYVTFPKTTEEAVECSRLLKNRKNLAIAMYSKGKISIGKAAELAGVSLQKLIKELQEKRLYIVEE